MDRLDRFSILAIIILLISFLAIMTNHMGEAKPGRNNQEKTASDPSVVYSKIEQDIMAVKDLIEGGNLTKAELLTKELIQKYPYEGEPRLMMGDIHMRKQQPVMAVLEYKEAVDRNPDYLDKQTPFFQGKKIAVAVKEAISEIERRIKENPEDAAVKKYRKRIYYLQRRIAGGCS